MSQLQANYVEEQLFVALHFEKIEVTLFHRKYNQ